MIQDFLLKYTLKYFKISSSLFNSELLKFDERASFVLNQVKVYPSKILFDYQKSGLKECIIYLPGLFSDESVWFSIANKMKSLGFYPIYIRFNPGNKIYQNGQELNLLLNLLLNEDPNFSFHLVTYSQSGLYLRSALLHLKNKQKNWKRNLKKAILVSSPDNGSYISHLVTNLSKGKNIKKYPFLEKLLDSKSKVVDDLVKGNIKKEENEGSYYGELDDIDCYQVISLLKFSFVGDGVVQRSSLEYLSHVYNQKGNGRVILLDNVGHMKIIQSEKLYEALKFIFTKKLQPHHNF